MRKHRDLLEILRANGMRITAGRRVLLQYILDNQTRGVRLREIYEHLDEQHERVDRTSVYRNLIAFQGLGIVQALRLPKLGLTYQYVLDRKIHHFYICKACGKARRGNHQLFARIDAALRETHGFAKANLSVVFYGTCAVCATSTRLRTRRSTRRAAAPSRSVRRARP